MDSVEEKSPAQWALDLLEPTESDYTESWLKYWSAIPFAATGFAAIQVRNYTLGRPIYFNIPLLIAATVVSGTVGFFVHKISYWQHAKDDAVMRDYIRLHPERFPKPDNRTYAEIMAPWTPYR